MVEAAADLIAALSLLAPGFVALKVFYILGLRTKRSDAEWAIWSVPFSVPLSAGAAWITGTSVAALVAAKEPPATFLVTAVALAIVAGTMGAWLWHRVSTRWRWLARQAAPRVWDSALSQPRCAEVWLKEGPVILGRVREVASSVDTEDPDLYLDRPSWVNKTTGARIRMTGIDGVLISREEIHFIQLYP